MQNIEEVVQMILPDIIRNFIAEKAMTDELFYDQIVQTGFNAVVLGAETINKRLIKRLVKRKVNTKRCTNCEVFEQVLKKNKDKILKMDYIYIITDRNYFRWMELLKEYEIPSTRYFAFPLYLLKQNEDK